MKNSKFSLLLVLALVLSMFLAACSGSDDTDEKETGNKENDGEKATEKAEVPQEFNMLDSSEIPTMDSAKATDAVAIQYLGSTNEGLYRVDQDQKPVPALVDGEPTVSDDGTVYTFKLKETKWSNGDPVTAHDFEYAWKRAINPETESEYGPYMMGGKIKNAEKITEAAAAKQAFDINELGVKALGDYELEVTFEKPIVFWEDLMAFTTFYPQNQKFVEEKGADYASSSENLLYNGPFVMTGWEGSADTEWALERNPEYWDAETVTLEKINVNVVKDSNAAVNAFEAGETDFTTKLSSDIVPNYEGDDRLLRYLESTVFWLKFNQEGKTEGNKALANKNIRLALSQGFNKDDLATSILNNGSVAANYAVPSEFVKHPETDEDFRAANGDMNTYNLEEAQKNWEAGLKEIGMTEVTIRYLGGDTEASKNIDSYIKNQLETNLKGLKIQLESVPFPVRLDRDTAQDYDIQMAGWGPDYGNAISFSDIWVTGSQNNKMGYSNPAYDKLVKSALSELGDKPKENFEALQQAEKILMDDAAIAPVYQRANNYLINPKVKNVVYHQVGPDFTFKWIKIEE